MSRSVTTPIKSSRFKRTVNVSPSAINRVILKPISDSSTRSDSINILADLPFVPDPDWSLYYEYDYIGKMDALDIYSVYTAETNKSASNPKYSRNYETSNPCTVCEKTGNNFDDCEILKTTTS